MHASLNRIILYVQDVERLSTFYQDAFQLPVVETIKGEWTVLRIGVCELALHRVGRPYRVADASLRCVDDTKSPQYNTVTVADTGEKMRRDDELYRYTIFVRHNDARTPGLGSCIFLHVWRDAQSPTVGCTAMALDDLRALLQWADSSTAFVQLPRAEYDARQRAWDLPQRK